MKAIWKYQFVAGDNISIRMPEGAIVLSVQTQNDVPCLWAIVETSACEVIRNFRCYGTGHKHNKIAGKFIGTFQMLNGTFVGHLFEEV